MVVKYLHSKFSNVIKKGHTVGTSLIKKNTGLNIFIKKVKR